jgi:hypothetical protein
LCAITFPFFWLGTSIEVIGMRIPCRNISSFDSAQDEHRASSSVFVARRIRANGHPAKVLKPFVVRLYKKITLGGFAFQRIAAGHFVLWNLYKRRILKPLNRPIWTK